MELKEYFPRPGWRIVWNPDNLRAVINAPFATRMAIVTLAEDGKTATAEPFGPFLGGDDSALGSWLAGEPTPYNGPVNLDGWIVDRME